MLYQNRAYIIWLQDLVSEMKRNDSKRPLIVDLEVNQLSKYHSRLITENIDGIDGFGLVVKDERYLGSLLSYFKHKKIRYVYSEIEVDVLLRINGGAINQSSFFISSWKDTHESNKLTFNGITDRNGNFKRSYFMLMNALKDSNLIIDDSNFRILRQTIPLYANNTVRYYAVGYNKRFGWNYGQNMEGYSFEWALVKCDKFGNYIALKDLGNGPVFSLKIPENHEYFKLLLTVYNRNQVTTDIVTLNTPFNLN